MKDSSSRLQVLLGWMSKIVTFVFKVIIHFILRTFIDLQKIKNGILLSLRIEYSKIS